MLSAARLQRDQRKSEKCAETACYRRWTPETHPTRHLGGMEKENEHGDDDVMIPPTKIDAVRRMEEDLYA